METSNFYLHMITQMVGDDETALAKNQKRSLNAINRLNLSQ